MDRSKKLIQLIHVARSHTCECVACGSLVPDTKEQCGCGCKDSIPMSEDRYRRSLEQLTGHRSCSHLDESQLEKVLDLFKRAGFTPVKTFIVDPKKTQHTSQEQMVYRLEEKAKEVLGEQWKARLDGFLRNMNRSSLKFCNSNDLRKIHGWLSRMKKRQGA